MAYMACAMGIAHHRFVNVNDTAQAYFLGGGGEQPRNEHAGSLKCVVFLDEDGSIASPGLVFSVCLLQSWDSVPSAYSACLRP